MTRPACPDCHGWPMRRVAALTAGAWAWLCGCGFGWECD